MSAERLVVEYNVSPTEHITLTQERLAQRAFDLTAPSKKVGIQTFEHKSDGLHDAFAGESCFGG